MYNYRYNKLSIIGIYYTVLRYIYDSSATYYTHTIGSIYFNYIIIYNN